MVQRDKLSNQIDQSLNQAIKLIEMSKELPLDKQLQLSEKSWTGYDLLRHISSAIVGLTSQITLINQGSEGVPNEFDINQYNKKMIQKLNTLNLDDIKASINKSKEKLHSMIYSFKDEDFEKTGRHPTLKLYSIEQFFKTIAIHTKGHTTQFMDYYNLS